MFGQFSDEPFFGQFLDGQLPKFSDIGRTRTDFSLKVAPLVMTPSYHKSGI